MKILVLDTIHGGTEIAAAYRARGHDVDAVDVYRHESDVTVDDALHRNYNCIIAPVHLDPDHPLLKKDPSRVISHHEAVRRILDDRIPSRFIEITGARGKTTTALALAACLPGKGVVHTSGGTFLVPENTKLWKRSITPASVIPAAEYAYNEERWLIAEESLGVTGAGNLAILTSPEDYPVAAGKQQALGIKIQSADNSKQVLVTSGISASRKPGWIDVSETADVAGERGILHYNGKTAEFTSPLLHLAGYQVPLMLAGTAALILGGIPEKLSGFTAIPGRLSVEKSGDRIIVDNSNSGTNAGTTKEAAILARRVRPDPDLGLTLVIGQEAHAVCEGFSPESVNEAIREIGPRKIILVDGEKHLRDSVILKNTLNTIPWEEAGSMEEGKEKALRNGETGPVVLAVKRWR